MSDTPRYIDLQVNGYVGVDFNGNEVTVERLHAACVALRRDGVAGILATIITDAVDRMAGRLKQIARARQEDPLVRDMVWGFHVEGPFLNEAPGYAGAHPVEHVRPAGVDAMRCLLDAADGLVRLVTLAPERDAGLKVTSFLARQGILVAAGHCDPSLDQLRAAIDAGLSLFTHLGNGCPMVMHRHDNIIQRALSLSDRLTMCFIGDGVHVPYPALGNYLRLAGVERSVVVTDAISAAGLGPGRHRLGAQTIDIGEDLVAWSPDHTHFMGSTATMPRMVAGMRDALGLSPQQIEQLIVHNPLRILK